MPAKRATPSRLSRLSLTVNRLVIGRDRPSLTSPLFVSRRQSMLSPRETDATSQGEPLMIAINARFLTQETRGVQRFAEQVCLELGAMRKDLTFVAPQDTPVNGSAERLQVRRIGRNRGHLWEQLDLPLWLASNGRPPLVSLCNTAPLIYSNQIATHHDITYVRHPESYSRTFRGLYKGLTPLLLKRIKALITVSDFSRKEIARYSAWKASTRWSCTSSATPTRCSPATTTGWKAIPGYACSAASTTSSWCANTRAPPHSSFRRSTKASASLHWRRRPVAAR